MKRSKLFLGATTCLLAIAGIAASASHRFSSKAVFYYSQISGKHFVLPASAPAQVTFASTPAMLSVPKNGGGTISVRAYNSKVTITTAGTPLYISQ